ncbi:MAG: transporter substrate-binding domain-containing protein [Desulfarculaceae bacterium]|nr:transporter substrate-binding domain-containing protein [Desulfarculaceae bacterium]MCF8071370.1 transporter substrate-binding domain-containing protein [Desulfarculaceae bacterium]MCF8101695.1 transporter substrate-binding domain-containing protein [Desulfarculaceae bacterium]MCF8116696.1 transporter substrate-binding domain-containing protein [Desulfarculaceae bacterium]
MKKTASVWLGGLACLLTLLVAAACGNMGANQDPLTRKERAWLDDHGPIRVATDTTYHPFSFVGASGLPEGICVDMWKAMASKLGLEIELLPVDSLPQLTQLRAGTLDSTTGMFPLGERRLFLDFSDPFYPVTAAIFINETTRGVSGLESLRGMQVGAVVGDSGAALLIRNNINPVLYDTYRGCVAALGADQVDAVVIDDPVVLYWRKRLKMANKISWAPGNAVVERNDLALPVKKGNKILLSIINKGLALVSGTEIQRLRERYLH